MMYLFMVPGESTDPDIAVTIKPDGTGEYQAETNAEVIIRDADPIVAAHTAYVFTLNKMMPSDDD